MIRFSHAMKFACLSAVLVLAAAWLGKTRLIDNMAVKARPPAGEPSRRD